MDGRGNKKITDTNLFYSVDTVGGQSGGPVFIKNKSTGQMTVIGIHTGGYSEFNFNQGTRITTDILHFVYNNSHK